MGRKLFKIQALEKQVILNVSLNGRMDIGHILQSINEYATS